MIAQAYFDGQLMVRVFDYKGRIIADLPMKAPPCESTADDALRAMKLRRCEKWNDESWPGREAKVRFSR